MILQLHLKQVQKLQSSRDLYVLKLHRQLKQVEQQTMSTTTTFATVTQIFERTTASQAGTLFDTEVSSANDFVASFWDGSQWNES